MTRISFLTDRQIEGLLPQAVAIYRNAFTPPPYSKPETEIAEFARVVPTQFDRDAYRFVGAFAGTPERLVGFAYGYSSVPGQWWYENVRPALPAPVAARWLRNCFQFVEIAVDPSVRGQGIGARLHDALLRGLPHERAGSSPRCRRIPSPSASIAAEGGWCCGRISSFPVSPGVIRLWGWRSGLKRLAGVEVGRGEGVRWRPLVRASAGRPYKGAVWKFGGCLWRGW